MRFSGVGRGPAGRGAVAPPFAAPPGLPSLARARPRVPARVDRLDGCVRLAHERTRRRLSSAIEAPRGVLVAGGARGIQRDAQRLDAQVALDERAPARKQGGHHGCRSRSEAMQRVSVWRALSADRAQVAGDVPFGQHHGDAMTKAGRQVVAVARFHELVELQQRRRRVRRTPASAATGARSCRRHLQRGGRRQQPDGGHGSEHGLAQRQAAFPDASGGTARRGRSAPGLRAARAAPAPRAHACRLRR